MPVALLKLLQCSRRNNKANTTSHQIVANSMNKTEEMWKGHDTCDVSTDCISEHSSVRHASSDSDDSTMPDIKSSVAPPPGLELPEPLHQKAHPWSHTRTTAALVESHVANKKHGESHWNAQAASTVPENVSNFLALKEALDRLDSSEMATVRSLLDSKLQDSTEQPRRVTTSFGAASHRFAPLEPTANRRPFAPFQGHRTSTLHTMKRKKVQDIEEASGDTLRTFLRDLALVDDGRVLALRKISKLGLNSSELLETYFTKFGKVERIMVSHTLTKGSQSSSQKPRLRPAALGFALMSTVEEAQAALKHGETHTVTGMDIAVVSFKSHSVVDGTD